MEWFVVLIWLGGIALLSVRSFELGAILLAASAPLYLVRLSVFGMPTTLLELEIVMLAIIAATKYRSSVLRAIRPRTISEKTLIVSIIAFIVSASVSVFLSADRLAALGIWRAYFIEPLFFFIIIISAIKTPDQIRRMIIALSLGAALIAIGALIQSATGCCMPAPWAAERRATSFFPYPNAVGLYLAPLIPLLVALIVYSSSRIQKIWCAIVVALLVAGIIAAKTVGALVALVVVGIIGGIAWNASSRQWILRLLISAAVVVIVAPSIYNNVQKKLFFQEWSGTVRQIMWRETIPMLQDHWLIGAGLAGYKKAFEPYHKAQAIEIFLYPHNIILNFWSELGIYGLMSVIALVVVYYSMLVGARSREDRALIYGLAGAMLVILIHGSVDVPYFKNDLALMWWALFACALIMNRHKRLAYEQ